MTDAAADVPGDDVDAIAAALARLRGGRRGGGPGGPFGPGTPFGPGPRGRGHEHPGDPGHAAHEWLRGARGAGAPGPGGSPGGAGGAAGGDRWGGPARMRLLEALVSASHPLSVSEVGGAIGVDQPRASRLIQQAVELGLVRREADPDDARRTRVALTDEGTKVVRGFRGQRREHLSQALAGFTPDERVELARLLAKLADAWPRA